MKIAHLCLSCFYIDDFAYQENVLVAEHVLQGHEVIVVASTEVYGDDKRLAYVQPSKYIGSDGAEVFRLPYGIKPHAIGRKLRWYPGLRRILDDFSPDLIFFHGLCGLALIDVALYVRRNNSCKFVVDCHEDFNNSAKSFLSRYILHTIVYKPVFKWAQPTIDRIFAVTSESLDFAVDFYGAPKKKVRLLPLGGYIPSETQLKCWRTEFRQALQVEDNHVLIAQTGKFDRSKLLVETIRAFMRNDAVDLRLVIAGRMTPDVEQECRPLLLKDPRIMYLGWQSPTELSRTLAGVDFFLQPFGQTVTTQQAMCSGCAILLQDLPSHRWLFCNNGYLFKDFHALPQVFDWIKEQRDEIENMRSYSRIFSKENLDYKLISTQCLEMDSQ